jgi:lon-related putative ATP-dependent protease
MSTPGGYTLAPLREGALISPEEYEKLPKEEQEQIDATIEAIRKDLREVMRQVPILQRERRQRLKALNEDVSTATVGQIFNGMAKHFADLPPVLAYIEAMRRDVIENVEAFFDHEEESPDKHSLKSRAEEMIRYSINVLVDNAATQGAPVIYEDNPTFLDLIGRVEHSVEMGTLVTDFTLIKSGALHRANGGYLLLDARKVLSNPFAYDSLKRALASKEIRIQTLEQMLSLASTLSLEPEPIPLDLKVVLVGERLLYYLLKEYDPEFGLMFKVAADFAEDLPRNPENTLLYARLIASLQQREGLRPLNRAAVGGVIEECSRRAEDAEKISLDTETLSDLLREADYCAAQNAEIMIRLDDVHKAIRQQEYRHSQWRERMQESMLRNIQLVDTAGSRVGQVNGLSVIQLGDYAFGQPARITATVRLGDGKVIDIEREAKLGGDLHSKGVMILSACLANRYARERPLPIAASLVFEQSYGMVDGDSASTAELCVLLSALGQIPLRQDLAVTGSINQHGEVQAIGGVNQKIEGFFGLCQARGLTGTQGVIIPHANVVHLMLRDEVVQAVQAGRFAIYAARNVDEVLELLSGLPPERFNLLIHEQVEKLWALHKQYQGGKDDAEPGKSTD